MGAAAGVAVVVDIEERRIRITVRSRLRLTLSESHATRDERGDAVINKLRRFLPFDHHHRPPTGALSALLNQTRTSL